MLSSDEKFGLAKKLYSTNFQYFNRLKARHDVE